MNIDLQNIFLREKRHITFSFLHNWFKHLFNESINTNHNLGYWYNGQWNQDSDTNYEPHPIITPTMSPSIEPTIEPSLSPSVEPSLSPSMSPTIETSLSPSVEPSLSPTLNQIIILTNKSVLSQSSNTDDFNYNLVYIGVTSLLVLTIFFILSYRWKKKRRENAHIENISENSNNVENIDKENIYVEPTPLPLDLTNEEANKDDNFYENSNYETVTYEKYDNYDIVNYDHIEHVPELDANYEEIILKKENNYEYEIDR